MADTFIFPNGAPLQTAGQESRASDGLRDPQLTQAAREVSVKAVQPLNSIRDKIRSLFGHNYITFQKVLKLTSNVVPDMPLVSPNMFTSRHSQKSLRNKTFKCDCKPDARLLRYSRRHRPQVILNKLSSANLLLLKMGNKSN